MLLLAAALAVPVAVTFAISAISAWRGVFRPNLVTWCLWSATSLVAGIAAIVAGAGWAAAPPLLAGAGMAGIVAAAVWSPQRALWPVRRWDLGCAAVAVAAVAGWLVTGNPVVAVGLAVIADVAASAPSLVKTWSEPGTEAAAAYIPGLLIGAAGVAAVDVWIVEAWLFPAYTTVNAAVFITLILARGRRGAVVLAQANT